jgi:hypothetical protein
MPRQHLNWLLNEPREVLRCYLTGSPRAIHHSGGQPDDDDIPLSACRPTDRVVLRARVTYRFVGYTTAVL